MSQGIWTAIIAVAVVALLGLLLRRASVSTTPGAGSPPPQAGPDDDEAAVDDLIESLEGIPVAVTSDGWAFMPLPDRDRVRLIPPLTPREMEQVVPRAAADQLARGELIAARLKRGAPDHDPWRLEALGRDGEYRAWRFETEDAGRAALALVSRSIVVAPRDPDGAEIALGDADFVEARRREEEIEAELASMPDVEERPEPPARRPLE
jgi:hypothetical protein